jgi:hypothetical protein
LGISTLRDRVCMTAAMLVLEPIFEADLPPEQYAYRPGRIAQQAVVEVEALLFRGHPDVVDADLADYFGSIPHAELLKSVARRIVDRRVLHLIKMWGVWGRPSFPGFAPPPAGPGPVTNRARAPSGSSSLYGYAGDYTNPILKPEAAEVVKKYGEIELNGALAPNPRNQCQRQSEIRRKPAV